MQSDQQRGQLFILLPSKQIPLISALWNWHAAIYWLAHVCGGAFAQKVSAFPITPTDRVKVDPVQANNRCRNQRLYLRSVSQQMFQRVATLSVN